MKLKLKVSKQLKRELKILSEKLNVERNEFVTSSMVKFIDENKSKWEDLIAGYPEFIEQRKLLLKTLKDSLELNEALTVNEKTNLIKEFYKEHKMYLPIHAKQKKFENIIIHLDEEHYYALQILAEQNGMVIENYGEKCLHHFR